MRTTLRALAALWCAVVLAGCPTGTTTTTTTTTIATTTTTTLVDTVAPSVPVGLTAAATSCARVHLAWNASTDMGGSGVAGYDVRRSGTLVTRVLAPSLAFDDAGLASGVAYAYTVASVDAAGNVSGPSAVASATTPACAGGTPVAHAGPDVFTQSLSAVAFDGSTSSDPDGPLVAWTWTFGDGATATGPSVSHAYAHAGTYVATLTVTDGDGLAASDTATVSVANRAPAANAGADRTVMPGAAVAFAGAGADLDGTIAAYAWSFGDGGVASGASASHVFATAGTYTVRLTVTDDGGAQGSDTALVTVVPTWSHAFGSPGEDRAQAVAIDAGGNVALAGYFSGTIDLGTGPLTSEHLPWLSENDYKDVLVARYLPDGVPLWARRIGAEADDRANGVATDVAGNVAITGSVSNYVDFGDGTVTGTGGSNDAFVAVYAAADGAYLWARRMGGSGSETGYAIAVDAAGNVVVAGTFQGAVDFGTGFLTAAGGTTDQDIFVAKYSPTGTPLWTKRFGGATAFEYVYGVAVDAAGDVLLAGAFSGTVGFGGAALASAGGYDAVLVKLSGGTGAHVWSKGFGGTGDDYGYGVAVDPSGNVALTGAFRNTADFGGGPLASAGGSDLFLASFTPSGAHRWSRRAGGSGDDAGRAVAVAGDLVVTGAFQGTVDFGAGPLVAAGGGDQFVARYGAAGTLVWARRFGGLGYQYGAAIAMGASGNPIVAGYFQTAIDLGSGTLGAVGLYDGVVASLAP